MGAADDADHSVTGGHLERNHGHLYMMCRHHVWAPSPGAGHAVDHEAQAAALVKSIADEKFDGARTEIAFRSTVLHPRD